MASMLKEYYKPWVGSAKRIGLILATISTIFLFTGTACLAGSSAFHRYHGLSLEHWKRGYHHPVRSQKHKRHRFFNERAFEFRHGSGHIRLRWRNARARWELNENTVGYARVMMI